MEEVYTPTDFFNLPDYLQRKILIEELDLDSIQNLCDAVSIEKNKNPRAVKFFQDFCENVQFWQDKFQYDFPRSFPSINRDATKTGAAKSIFYWKNSYEAYKKTMPLWEEAFIKDSKDGDLRGVRGLLLRGVDPNIQDTSGSTALMLASKKGYPEIVEMLLGAGSEVDIQNNYGYTALIGASIRGRTEIVEVLLGAGSEVDIQSKAGITALMEASGGGHTEIVKMLLDKGAEVNLHDEDGNMALMWAGGFIEIVKMLLDAGADVNSQDDEGYTALLSASLFGYLSVVELLLAVGADVNAQNKAGNTALIITMKNLDESLEEVENIGDDPADVIDEYIPTIFTVIKHNPDPDIPNDKGETAVEIAQGLGLDSVVDALLYLRRQKTAL